VSAAEKHLEEMMRDCCYHEAAHAVSCVSRGV
jgi:hypothetical protein